MRSGSFLVVGDANADVVAPVPAFPVEGDDLPIQQLLWASGGSAANVATGFALLGAPAALLARVGGDPAAAVALRAATNAGVDLASVQRYPEAATGICYAIISPGGERTFLSYRGANVGMMPPQADLLDSVAWLHIAGHALLEGQQRETTVTLLEQAVQRGIPASLDLCLPLVRTHSQATRTLLPKLHVLFGNMSEMRALEPFANRETLFVIKRGAEGCELRGAEPAEIAGFPMIARDTNGCGDAFIAAFLCALAAGRSFRECAVIANAAGAIAATRPGAAEAMPTLADLRAFLARHVPDVTSI